MVPIPCARCATDARLEQRGRGRRVLIVHESRFGTNRKIAEAIASGSGDHVGVAIVEARATPRDLGSDVDLLLVGGPNPKAQLPTTATRMEAAARGGGVEPSDRGPREWLAELRILPSPPPCGTPEWPPHETWTRATAVARRSSSGYDGVIWDHADA